LRGLHPLFSESEPDNAVRDNAAGAVARMIMVHPEAIPLNQVRIHALYRFKLLEKINSFSVSLLSLCEDMITSLHLSGSPCFSESSSS